MMGNNTDNSNSNINRFYISSDDNIHSQMIIRMKMMNVDYIMENGPDAIVAMISAIMMLDTNLILMLNHHC